LVAILAISNGLIIRQNFQMREALAKDRPPVLKAGESVPPFTAKNLNGKPLQLVYAGQGPKKMFFYFTPPCKYCKAQFAYWRDILAQAEANQFEVIGLVSETEDLAALKAFLVEMRCASDSPAPLQVALVPDEILRRYKLSPTPATLIVSNAGRIEKAWIGLWDETGLADASSALGVSISSR
jgi:peroxiredoxin